MTIKNAIKKLEGKNIIVVNSSSPEAVYNRSFYAISNGHRLMITTQGEDISTMRVAPAREQDDPQSDYFAGYYVETMPQVFRAMGIN